MFANDPFLGKVERTISGEVAYWMPFIRQVTVDYYVIM